MHNERFEIKCLLALHPLHELDKPTISTSIEFLKNDLIFVDQSLQEYQALLKKDREEILNKQQLHPAVLIETEMRVVQLKNDLTNLNHRATITKTYKKEHQDIINGLSPERMQSQKTFDQMLKMTNEALVKALLTSHRDLLEAHGSLTAEQRAKLKDAIEDTKLFQRSDL